MITASVTPEHDSVTYRFQVAAFARSGPTARVVRRGPGIHAQIGRAGDEQQATRRAAFLGWFLERTYGSDSSALKRAAEDLGGDLDESAEGIDTYLDLVADTIKEWVSYRESIRGCVPPPMLDAVPKGRGLRRANRHWYYEFRTVGRRLTEQQRLELCAELPQANLTSDSLVLDQWSDLTGHPIFELADDVFSRYFDAGLHFHQSGSRSLWMRLPAVLAHRIAPYEAVRGFVVNAGTAHRFESVLEVAVGFGMLPSPGQEVEDSNRADYADPSRIR